MHISGRWLTVLPIGAAGIAIQTGDPGVAFLLAALAYLLLYLLVMQRTTVEEVDHAAD